jgi:(p)ppGpp synthase/HD superfamily hydrolase
MCYNKNMQNITYPDIGRKRFLARLDPLMSPQEMEIIETAYMFAKYGHKEQMRDSGVRYFEHPKAVAWIIIDELKLHDWRTIAMALMHDLKEDSWILSWWRIQVNFGKSVTLGLKLLTKDPKKGYLKRLRTHGTWRELTVKICDRLNNMRTLQECPPKKIVRQLAETQKEFFPLCDILAKKLPSKDRWRAAHLKKELLRAYREVEKTITI